MKMQKYVEFNFFKKRKVKICRNMQRVQKITENYEIHLYTHTHEY